MPGEAARVRGTASGTDRDRVLSAAAVEVRYPGRTEDALAGVSLAVEDGERIALLGASGSGKSTLLRALEGSVAITGGQIARPRFAALVYQDLRLVGEETVLDNVCAGALREIGPAGGVLRFPRRIRERAHALLAEIGLGEHALDRAGELSGGQRQRVAIARALCAEPAVLLADEPLGSLDPANASRVLALLGELQSRHGFALVVSLHDRGVDGAFFDRWIVLRDGAIACETADAAEAWRALAAPDARSRVAAADAGPRPASPDSAGAAVATGRDTPNAPTAHATAAAARLRRRRAIAGAAAAGLLLALFWAAHGVGLRAGSFGGAASGIASFLAAMVPGSAGELAELPWAPLARALLETIRMALVGTAIGIAISLPLAILAARETSPRAVRLPVRFLLNVVRTVPSIFWALLFVAFLGLGPIAGVFALAAYSTGYLTKLFYEALEDVDDRPALALRALGGSRLQTLARAILPAARPLLLGACLFVFEYNIRAASVLGVVGAGGIGQDLMYYVEWRNFPAAVAGLAMILVVVVALDAISEVWRRRLGRQRGT